MDDIDVIDNINIIHICDQISIVALKIIDEYKLFMGKSMSR